MTRSANQSSQTELIGLKKECKHVEVGEAKKLGDARSTKLRITPDGWAK